VLNWHNCHTSETCVYWPKLMTAYWFEVPRRTKLFVLTENFIQSYSEMCGYSWLGKADGRTHQIRRKSENNVLYFIATK
jgi:hypothetical protein